MIELPVSVLYRIFTQSKILLDEMDESKNEKIIEFLFKCLKKHKQEPSVLFLNLNLKYNRVEFFSRLVKEFQNIFDIRMIDPCFLFNATKDILDELGKLKLDYSNSINQINQLLDERKNEAHANFSLPTREYEKEKRIYTKLIKSIVENHGEITNIYEVYQHYSNRIEQMLKLL